VFDPALRCTSEPASGSGIWSDKSRFEDSLFSPDFLFDNNRKYR
jgi:hypothetical protein